MLIYVFVLFSFNILVDRSDFFTLVAVGTPKVGAPLHFVSGEAGFASLRSVTRTDDAVHPAELN